MKRIILDTNFLLIPFTLKIDVFSEIKRIMYEPYEIMIVKETINELEKIQKEQKGKHKLNAKAALQLVKSKKLLILDTSAKTKKSFRDPKPFNENFLRKQKDLNRKVNSKDVIADDIILEISDNNTIVATQDKLLQKNLKNKNIRLIILKNKTLEIKDVL